MKKFLGAALVFLAACNTPSPHFRGAEVTRITVQGSTFDVRRRGRLAEAIRVNPQYAPRLGAVARRAETAIEQVTGCPVRELRGDAAVVLGILKCGQPDDLARIRQGPQRAVPICDRNPLGPPGCD
ncbi:hypothetical protein SAMN04490248_12940 [Salinihabitans flavidus]|uniref:Lipoprotein n=1 Tax=Salinihabitans flavidus TaxID=569882 RepID=A0A1H8VI42_9RHOB|nr:hypothetical protein [Salinihabitans flavidus]SEP14974.1 hypothetical protein SAMN04490248_12940 [Salinihabitans flavidus]